MELYSLYVYIYIFYEDTSYEIFLFAYSLNEYEYFFR